MVSNMTVLTSVALLLCIPSQICLLSSGVKQKANILTTRGSSTTTISDSSNKSLAKSTGKDIQTRTTNSSVCKTSTEGGGEKGNGKKCMFPFIYQNIKYERCITVDSNTGPWCSTNVDESRHHIEEAGYWGLCPDSCPVEDEPYKCSFHHCMVADAKFRIYKNTSGECKACQAKCSSDPSCAVVECDYFDKRKCIWQNSTSCYHSTSIKLAYSTAYQTCLKPPKRNGHCKNGTYLEVEGCCTKDNPCEVNEGDCNSDEDCKGDLRCGQANCDANKFGYKSKTDCCYEHTGDTSKIIAGIFIPMLVILLLVLILLVRRRRDPHLNDSKTIPMYEKDVQEISESNTSLKLRLRTFSRLHRRLSEGHNSLAKLCQNENIKTEVTKLSYNANREVSKSAFEIGSEIGKGNFGEVYRGTILGLNITVAIKSITANQTNEQEFAGVLDEIKIMSHVDPHINLVSMVGACTSDFKDYGQIWILLEFCQFDSLKEYLRNHKDEILPKNPQGYELERSRCLIQWSYDIANGMKYLAQNHIMHGDLAARNILMSEGLLEGTSKRPIAKVADFGLSKRFYDNVKYSKESRLYVPWKWMALEYLINDYFTLTSDVWSFGVLFWELLSFGRTPYGQQDYDELIEKLKSGYRLSCPHEINQIISWKPKELFQNLSEICFKADPMERASFSEVLTRIEKELTVEEISHYEQMSEKYRSTLGSRYSRLSVIER